MLVRSIVSGSWPTVTLAVSKPALVAPAPTAEPSRWDPAMSVPGGPGHERGPPVAVHRRVRAPIVQYRACCGIATGWSTDNHERESVSWTR